MRAPRRDSQLTDLTVRPPPPEFTPEEIDLLLQNLNSYTPEEQAEIYKIVEELEVRKRAEASYNDLIAFCCAMQPDYKVGKHHRILADLLMEIEKGKTYNEEGEELPDSGKDRVCVNMPPRHGKSQLISIYFPAWFLGRNPDKKVLMVSHTTDLAVDFGRKVRNLIGTEQYQAIFPNVQLAQDSKSAGRWNTNAGGEYFACGVGSALAGRGAHLLLIDDPHNEQDIINGNLDVFDKAYEWFTYGARTRLMPGGRVAIVQCMVGGTGVLLPDGTEKRLDCIRPGDMVATYDGGKLAQAKVLNWMNQGSDRIYTIAMSDGRLVRANERHPFLVQKPDRSTEWIRLRNLKPGMALVSLKGATELAEQRQSQVNAEPADQKIAGIKNILMRLISLWGTTGSTRVKNVLLRGVLNQLRLKEGATTTTQSTDTMSLKHQGQGNTTAQTGGVTPTSNLNMALTLWSTPDYWKSRILNALSVSLSLMRLVSQRVGVRQTPLLLTTATTLAESEGFSATTATSLSNTMLTKDYYGGPFTTSTIDSVVLSGYEDVFDIEVERTHNFIANGIVSSNTRWHLDDLTGRVTRDMAQSDLADEYEVVEFPAILEIEKEIEDPDTHKIVTKTIEKPLWPEFFNLDALYRTKASMPLFQWNAQYQQKPTAEEAAIVKREWWKEWKQEDPPRCAYVIMSLDAAAEKNNRADYTALTTWGVFFNEEENRYSIILLNSIKKRVEFPELKELAYGEFKSWEPDAFIVEKKSSGTPLYQEMRRMGLVVQEYTPHRGSGDKIARLNSVADIVSSGLVWVPQTRWAEELVEEVAGFPFVSHDDLVDSTIMALMRFRQGGFIRLPTDEADKEPLYRHRGGFY